MGDINRVFTHIDGYLDSSGGKHCDILSKVIGECVEAAKRGYVDKDLEDQALVVKIDAAASALKRLGETVAPCDMEALKRDFRAAAIEAMACRRSILPLVPVGRPWVTLDPNKTLFDDDDQYSFAIYDTLADEIAKLLPALEQIACECAWEPTDGLVGQTETGPGGAE
jgi:hypothetical protein